MIVLGAGGRDQQSTWRGKRRSPAGAAMFGSNGWPTGIPVGLAGRASCAAWLGW